MLHAVHQCRPPTFFVTIQWNSTVETGQLRQFDKRLSRSLREHSDRADFELRYYSIKEIDDRSLIHSHVMVRTDLGLSELQNLLNDRCQKISGAQARVTYCEPIGEAAAASRYATKNLKSVRTGEKKLLLFPPGFVRLRTQMRYFEPWAAIELKNEGRELWLHDVRQFKLGIQAITFDRFTSTFLERSAMLTTNVSEIAIPTAADIELLG